MNLMETERILLRQWREEDAAALFKYASDPAIGPIAGWPPHTSVENSREVIRDILSAPDTYAVVLKETNEPVGSVGIMLGDGIHSAEMEEGDAEIGYWIGVPYWGKGLIPEAVNRLLAHCFEEMGIRRVWCGYYDGNRKSRRVMDKCGFIFHHTEEGKISPLGDVRTEHFMRITMEEWQERRKIRNEVFDIQAWLERFRQKLTALFGDRLLFLGLQGSYGRGEQTAASDIDVVVILDKVGFEDLSAYRNLLDTMDHRELICGFVAGWGELEHWEKSDLAQLLYDTRPIVGSLERVWALLTDEDICRAVLIGACGLYHACSHNFLHARDGITLAALYKTARFIVRMRHLMRSGHYIASMGELARNVPAEDRRLLEVAGSITGEEDEETFAHYSCLLLEWTSAVIGARPIGY